MSHTLISAFPQCQVKSFWTYQLNTKDETAARHKMGEEINTQIEPKLAMPFPARMQLARSSMEICFEVENE